MTASDHADYKLEYYTPTEEVALCGHATIALFATMKSLGMLSVGILHRFMALTKSQRPLSVRGSCRFKHWNGSLMYYGGIEPSEKWYTQILLSDHFGFISAH